MVPAIPNLILSFVGGKKDEHTGDTVDVGDAGESEAPEPGTFDGIVRKLCSGWWRPRGDGGFEEDGRESASGVEETGRPSDHVWAKATAFEEEIVVGR